MKAEGGHADSNNEDDAENDDDSSFLFGPVFAFGELHGDIARLEGLYGCHFED